MKLEKRKKILVYLIAAVALAFFIQRAVFSGFIVKLKKLNSQIKLEEEKLKMGVAVQKKKDEILQDYKDYSAYLKIGTQDREIAAKFLKEIEKISQASGVSVVNLNPDNQPEVSKEFKKFKAELRLDANMEQLLNFLYKIQESALLIKINKLSIESKDEQSGALRIEAAVSITVPL